MAAGFIILILLLGLNSVALACNNESEFLLSMLIEARTERATLLVKLESATTLSVQLRQEIHTLTVNLNIANGNAARCQGQLTDSERALNACRNHESVTAAEYNHGGFTTSPAPLIAGRITDEIRNVTQCENGDLTLTCPTGKIINILDANYGRTEGSAVCPHPAISTTNCHATNSKIIVTTRCNNKQTCAIPATNAVFGDPCVNTYKYLRVRFQCFTTR